MTARRLAAEDAARHPREDTPMPLLRPDADEPQGRAVGSSVRSRKTLGGLHGSQGWRPPCNRSETAQALHGGRAYSAFGSLPTAAPLADEDARPFTLSTPIQSPQSRAPFDDDSLATLAWDALCDLAGLVALVGILVGVLFIGWGLS